jgi:hypothetical protein
VEVLKTRQELVEELQILNEQYWDASEALEVARLARAAMLNRIRDLDNANS